MIERFLYVYKKEVRNLHITIIRGLNWYEYLFFLVIGIELMIPISSFLLKNNSLTLITHYAKKENRACLITY
ncbi:hypothetical protein SAMN02745751_02231 [Dethiosulfatibacter aminovorans DSM 17477]|uniref:Uncharacterized protein n=1 Tax=Dethiosulfatibacter aminovorans DSM 17477 TaxID=1121476 RepID=A0A1M6I8L6_9FIRM|nr:hypothetical protein SAMN02745751_02231 [Dethiosulfatibacter aminovorans DSM 17477]